MIYNRSGRVESGLEKSGRRGVGRPGDQGRDASDLSDWVNPGPLFAGWSGQGPAGSTINPNVLAPWFIRRFPGLQS